MAHGTLNQAAGGGSAFPGHIVSPLMDPASAAEYLGGLSIDTLAGWRVKHFGPSYVRVGRLIRYRQAELDAWLDAQVQRGA